MPETTIKIVRPHHPDHRSSGTGQCDLSPSDATELANWAQRVGKWQTLVDTGRLDAPGSVVVETLCAICDLQGRVAVWYGAITRAPESRMDKISRFTAADNALYQADLDDDIEHRWRIRATQRWNVKAKASGDRDVSELALAACRVIHRRAFHEEPAERDRYLAEMLDFTSSTRPNTPTILAASTETLAAASAMLCINRYEAAASLFKSTRTLQREAQMFTSFAASKGK